MTEEQLNQEQNYSASNIQVLEGLDVSAQQCISETSVKRVSTTS